MRLLTLVAGYVAGLAIATKYKSQTSKSKKTVDPTKSKLDLFIDDMVDLHKSAFADIKNTVHTSFFDDVKDFPTFKSRLTSLADTFSDEFESRLVDISGNAEEKKTQAIDWLESLYTKYTTTLTTAREKASTFVDGTTENVEDIVATTEADIHKTYSSAKKKLETAAKKMTK